VNPRDRLDPEPPRYATADGKPWPYTAPATFPLSREEAPGGWRAAKPRPVRAGVPWTNRTDRF